MRYMGGLAKKMPQTTVLMWIGSLAIIGFPFFSGYYSKESILELLILQIVIFLCMLT